MIGIIGDVHGHYDELEKVLKRTNQVTHWFQVGDLGGKDMSYPEFPSNFYFIKGNHENWDLLDEYAKKGDPHYLLNGQQYHFKSDGIPFVVSVLGGNYSPKNYQKRGSELSAERRRHFVMEEVQKIKDASRDENTYEVLLTHEAPSPFRKGNQDIGQPILTDLIKTIRPKVHFFGHHHCDRTVCTEGMFSYGLGYAGDCFFVFDLSTQTLHRLR